MVCCSNCVVDFSVNSTKVKKISTANSNITEHKKTLVRSMVATLSGKSGKTKKKDKSPEKSGENGGFRKNVMKSQEI